MRGKGLGPDVRRTGEGGEDMELGGEERGGGRMERGERREERKRRKEMTEEGYLKGVGKRRRRRREEGGGRREREDVRTGCVRVRARTRARACVRAFVGAAQSA